MTVTAYDAYGNVATGYTGTVSLSSSDPLAILVPSIYTFVAADAGEHNFSVTLETAGTQTITATGAVTASLTATESSITVKPAAASILEVTGFPTSDTAGAAGNVVVTAYDAVWQRGDRIHRHGVPDAAATRGPSCRPASLSPAPRGRIPSP